MKLGFNFLRWRISISINKNQKLLDQRLIDEIEKGWLINAVRIYRQETGATLKDSKAYVDRLKWEMER